MDRPPAAFGVEIDEGAIKRIARRPCGQDALEVGAAETAGDVFGEACDRRRDVGDGFAVACIGDAFAAAANGALGQFRHHDFGLGLRSAADGEGAGDRPALAAHGQGADVSHCR
jgi:hypothetical protein